MDLQDKKNDEILHLMGESGLIALREMQERKKADQAAINNIPNDYVFDLNDPNYTDYFYSDLAIGTVELGSIITVEISDEVTNTDYIDCMPLEKAWQFRRDYLSQEIEDYVEEKGSEMEMIAPMKDQIFLVKWPTWDEINEIMKGLKTSKKWKELMGKYYKRNETDERNYEGKWFRGLYIEKCSYSSPAETCGAFKFFLLDYGKEIIALREFMHKPIGRFMIVPQLILVLGILLDSERNTQYTEELHKKWGTILKPKMNIVIQTVFDMKDITYARLVNPTEVQLEAEYLAYVRNAEKIEIKRLRTENESKLLAFFDENNVNEEGLDEEFLQEKLNQLKYNFIQKVKAESKQKNSSSVPGRCPIDEIRPSGGYLKYELSIAN